MKEFQGKRHWRRLVYSLPVCILLTLLIFLLSGSVYRLFEKQRLVLEERQTVLTEVARLTARRAELTEEIARLSTDRGVEDLIRENFNVVKDGERVITFVTNEPATTTFAPSSPPPSWWQVIIEWFR